MIIIKNIKLKKLKIVLHKQRHLVKEQTKKMKEDPHLKIDKIQIHNINIEAIH